MNVMNHTSLPDNNSNINIRLFMLDPLSIIIKLAILGNKQIGTKILIKDNVVYLQDPGPFQAITRLYYRSNKTDLQYMYNPIQIACKTFLTKEYIISNPRMQNLFICAQYGLKKLMETYKNCSIITLCLSYYYTIITNHVEQIYNDNIFHKDNMTLLYTNDIIEKLNSQWTDEKIKIILDLINFLNNDNKALNNVKSLENIIDNIDKDTQNIMNII